MQMIHHKLRLINHVQFIQQQLRFLSITPCLVKGHSKWQNIKATKNKNDDARAKKINMYLKKVKAIVNKDGFDIKFNKKLAELEKVFIKESLPLDTFTKFIQRCKVFFIKMN